MLMERGRTVPLTEAERSQMRAIDTLPDDRIDLSDAPEVSDWSGAVRGRFHRPAGEQVTLRLDADLIDWFKRPGDDPDACQARINAALRSYVQLHSRDTIRD